MRRDPRAFLNDVIEAGSAIVEAVDGISLDDYSQSRLIRSSVERELTITGEALTQLDDSAWSKHPNQGSHQDPENRSRLLW